MRFLHTADLHLGISLGGFSLLREQTELLDQIIELVRRESLDGVLIAGDIFDRAVSGADAITLYDRFLTRLCTECRVPVFLIAGNHDGAARLTQFGGLLAGAGLHLAGRLTARPEPILCGEAELFLIPYFHVDQVRLLYPDAAIRSTEDAMKQLMDDVRQRRDPNRRTIVLAHCFVTGARAAESDLAAQLGGAQQIGAAVFEGVDYVALGHLHRAQSPVPGVHYAGSPFPYAFSESGSTVAVYDTVTGTVTDVPLHPSRTLRTCRGTYDELLAAAAQDLRADDYIKIELTDRGAGLETLDAFRSYYPHLVTLIGRQAQGNETGALTVSEVRALSPDVLLRRFCEEIGGYKPDADEITAFLDAMETVQRGGDLQ